ncbi:unnamed protein product [Cuscuta epithymum]|uniref:SWIM-type domain-containing protein n=2 Tax=Cuscuta epithymum TaxID=186058 RepID=A0AAV0C1P2_9ASTE|nr:unnamed protein product [Cuscuta epithymum]
MVNGKLILICQSGGSFVTSSDGSLTYAGGAANAMNITQETVFDDLKIKLAEVCDFDLSSVSVKYFLPGNNRTLINLKTDRDLKRMLDFHASSVTADIFVSGNSGFDLGVLGAFTNREPSVKLAESVNHNGSPAEPAAMKNYFEVAINYAPQPLVGSRKAMKSSPGQKLLSILASTDSLVALREDNSHSESRTWSSYHGSGEASDYASVVTSGAKADRDFGFDDCGTPAERVKKRRRTGDSNKAEVASGKKSSSNKNKDRGALTNVIVVDELGDLNGDEDLPEKLVASWKEGINGVGQDFRSVKEFREALHKYAIANRFVYRLKKNDTNRASGRCLIEGCSWRIHASWVHADQTFRIRKFNDEHTCGGESWKSAHPGKNWLVSIIKEKIRDSPNEKPRDVAKAIWHDFGIKLKYSQVWRGIKDAKEQLQGSYRKSYSRLPWFCKKIMESNPGSVTKLVISDEDKRFKHLFFSFSAAVNGFKNGCRPLIFLEALPLRSKYKETLLTANAVDADDGFFPVAFAIVDIESGDSWQWFLEQLKSAISTSQQPALTFISDREKSIEKHVRDVFQNSYHGYSIFHLMESLKKNMKGPFQGDGRGVIPGVFLAASHAVRLEAFNCFTERIKHVSSTTYDWVIQIDPAHWTTLLFKGVPYNHITQNPAEEYSKVIDDMRGSTVMQKIEALVSKLSNTMTHRREEARNCPTRLAPSKEKQLVEKAVKARSLNVLFSSEVVFEVHDDLTHVVNIGNLHCTCLEWKFSGLPCCHAVAVFLSTSKSVYDYCPHWFTVESFRSAYSELINPISGIGRPVEDEVDYESADVHPPLPPRFPAQQKEDTPKILDSNRRTVICSKCKEPGHNKASCKATL